MGKRYECKRAISPPRLDGVVSGEAWDSAPFTEKFENIVSSGETPYFSTRCKMRKCFCSETVAEALEGRPN